MLSKDELFDDLSRRYQQALREINALRKRVEESEKSGGDTTDTSAHSIQGLELLTVRINQKGIIDYANRPFTDFFKINKQDLIGKDYQILYKLGNQALLSKIRIPEKEGSETVEAMDEMGDHFKIKLTKVEGVLDILMENVTDQHRLKDYVKKYVNSDITDLSEEDLTTFKFPERRFM